MKKILSIAVMILLGGSLCYVSADDLLDGHGFLKGTGWTFYVAPDATKAGATVTQQEKRILVVAPAQSKQSAENIQLLKSLKLEPERRYRVKLKVQSDKEGKIAILYWGDTHSQLYASAEIIVEPGKEEYETKLTVKPGSDGSFEDARSLRLLIGKFSDATVTLTDISVEES